MVRFAIISLDVHHHKKEHLHHCFSDCYVCYCVETNFDIFPALGRVCFTIFDCCCSGLTKMEHRETMVCSTRAGAMLEDDAALRGAPLAFRRLIVGLVAVLLDLSQHCGFPASLGINRSITALLHHWAFRSIGHLSGMPLYRSILALECIYPCTADLSPHCGLLRAFPHLLLERNKDVKFRNKRRYFAPDTLYLFLRSNNQVKQRNNNYYYYDTNSPPSK